MSIDITNKNIINREYENNIPVYFEYLLNSPILLENRIEPIRFLYKKLDDKNWKITTILNSQVYEIVFDIPSSSFPITFIAKRGLMFFNSVMSDILNQYAIITTTIAEMVMPNDT